MSDAEFVSIVIPALNEEAYIERAVRGLVLEDGQYEILVMDGGSTDSTAAKVELLADEGIPVRLLPNPRKIQAAAVNLATDHVDPRARWLVRADAHCSYPQGFARRIAETLSRTGAQSVVVPMRTVGEESCFQRAVAAAQNSKFGNGGSQHRRRSGDSGWVDHGHHAGFDLEFFKSIGGYDGTFAVNEDAEYDVRVHKAGGRVWLEASALIDYYPRKTPGSLWKQYFAYGKGRARTTVKHRVRPKLRQMVPVAAFAGSMFGLAVSPFCILGLLLPFGYAALCLALGFREARRIHGSKCEAAMGTAFVIMHMAWAAGFIGKAFEAWRSGRAGSA